VESDHGECRGEQSCGSPQASLSILLFLRAVGLKQSTFLGTPYGLHRRKGDQDAHADNMTQRAVGDNLVTK
jgi:hypothetical protein